MTTLLVLLTLGVSRATAAQPAPRADHHQHLFSPATAALISTAPASVNPIFARDLVALLDSAEIQRAVVLSMGYTWGSPNRSVENEYDKVRAENDWTSHQVALYPDRLDVSSDGRRAVVSQPAARKIAIVDIEHGVVLAYVPVNGVPDGVGFVR